jgi:hypothetical protein
MLSLPKQIRDDAHNTAYVCSSSFAVYTLHTYAGFIPAPGSMAEKLSEYLARPSRDTASTTDTDCSHIKEQPQLKEGGTEAWLTLLGSFLVYYSSYGALNSFGFFQDYYQNDFLRSTSPSTISFVGTLQIALMNCLATVSGAICDAHGVRVSPLPSIQECILTARLVPLLRFRSGNCYCIPRTLI